VNDPARIFHLSKRGQIALWAMDGASWEELADFLDYELLNLKFPSPLIKEILRRLHSQRVN